jgi:hypothetical protein
MMNSMASSCLFLVEYGITLPKVQDAYKHLLSSDTPCVEMRSDVQGGARFDLLVDNLINVTGSAGGVFKMSSNNSDKNMTSTGTLTKVPNTPAMLVISTDPTNDEAIAATRILVGKIKERVMRVSDQGICCLMDHIQNPEGIAMLVRQARAGVIMLSAGSLESIPQLMAIVEIMAMSTPDRRLSDGSVEQAVGDTRSDAAFAKESISRPAVIPVNIPGFVFPGEKYFEKTLPLLWPRRSTNNLVKDHMQSFFKRIAIPFSTDAADQVLDVQAHEVFMRVPIQFKVSRAAAPPLLISLDTEKDGPLSPKSDHSSTPSEFPEVTFV